MKNNFGKNDKLLFHAFVVGDVVAIVSTVIGVIYGVIAIVEGALIDDIIVIITGVMLIVGVIIYSLVYWVFIKVMLNMLCDVKLIRNRLYNIDNDYLAGLTGSKKTDGKDSFDDGKTYQSASGVSSETNQTPISSNVARLKELKALKALMDEGVLTQEEFDAEKQKLLQRN